MVEKWMESVTEIDFIIEGNLHTGSSNLPFYESARRRPGLYLGAANAFGIFNMVNGCIGNLLGMAGKKDGVCIQVRLAHGHIALHINQVEMDGAAESPPYLPPFFDIKVALALAAEAFVAAEFGGKRFERRFEKGVLTEDAVHAPQGEEGFTLRFTPDEEVFGEACLGYFPLMEKCQHHAMLHPGVTFALSEDDKQLNTLCYPGGMAEYLKLFGGPDLHGDAVHIEGQHGDIYVEAAIARGSFADTHLSFAGGEHTPDGGAHVDGLLDAIRFLLEKHHPSYLERGIPFEEGFYFILAVTGENIRYAGSTKRALCGRDMREAVCQIATRQLDKYVKDPKWLWYWQYF